jgi:hypothetical protein
MGLFKVTAVEIESWFGRSSPGCTLCGKASEDSEDKMLLYTETVAGQRRDFCLACVRKLHQAVRVPAVREVTEYPQLCDHLRIRRGKDSPRVHGSDRTYVCQDCKMYYFTNHHNERHPFQGRWRPAEHYEIDTETSDE